MENATKIEKSTKPNKSTGKARGATIEAIWGFLFILPMISFIYFFSLGPIIYSFSSSFTEWDGITTPVFVGLGNYKALFANPEFWQEFLNTLTYTVGVVPISLLLSILLADALNRSFKGRDFFRTVFFLPSVTMPVAIAIVWKWLYNSDYGIINSILSVFGIQGPSWVGDPRFAMPSVVIVTIWRQVGYNMIILLAGLQGISSTYYEAASIEGASRFKQFTKITLPLLSPTIFFLSIIMLIDAFKAFDFIYIFSGGSQQTFRSPSLDALRTIVYGIFENGFKFLRMGYASAEAVVLFGIILIVTLIQFYFQKKWVHYD